MNRSPLLVLSFLFFACSSGADGTAPSASTTEPPPPRDTSRDDEFSGTTLDPAWTSLNGSQFEHTVGNGMLRMTTTAYCVWFNDEEGPALVKLTNGNFKVTTSMRARSAKNPALPPPPDFQFAGLIARDPASAGGQENYVFTVMGDRGGYLTNETKTTVNNSSQVHGPQEGRTNADSELRICRVGQVFNMYNRPPGTSTWKLEQSYNRASAPLPAALQVGPIVYSYTGKYDLVGEFDYVRFGAAASLADCTTD